VVKKRNLGLTSKQKLLGQMVIAILVYFGLRTIGFDTAIRVPGTEISFDIGIGYVLLLFVMLVGASNAVNLTDGLDGLVAGTSAIAFGAFA
ncbi:phospho-N-acetylmuramoyl-pentapeptide-transferase, partial [Micrococcus sp. SIMBA_131]